MLHQRALVVSENCYLSYQVEGAWPEEAMHVKNFAGGQEEPGSIMRVKLATESCHEQKSSNCPHQSKIKGFNNQWDLRGNTNEMGGGAQITL